MSASLDTIVTNIQNITSAINVANTNFVNVNGLQDFWKITSPTVVRVGAGRIARISVIVAGSATGTVYDASIATDLSRPLYIIPMTLGFLQEVNLPVQYGVLIVPGTGMTVSGSFS